MGALTSRPFIYKRTGPYEVGAADVEYAAAPDRRQAPPPPFGAPATVLCRLYYPSDSGSESAGTQAEAGLGKPVDHLAWIPEFPYARGYASFLLDPAAPVYSLKRFLFTLASAAFGWYGHARIQARPNLPLAPRPRMQGFPVLVFSHGLSGMRTMYSSLAIELASHGFVVAAIEHRDGSASATRCSPVSAVPTECLIGRHERDFLMYHKAIPDLDDPFEERLRRDQLAWRVTESRLALDLIERLNDGAPLENHALALSPEGAGLTAAVAAGFAGRLDLGRPLVGGHSFGGATALVAARLDPRFKGMLLLDPWLMSLSQEDYHPPEHNTPACILTADGFAWKKQDDRMADLLKRRAMAKAPTRAVTLRHCAHQNHSDLGLAISTAFLVKEPLRYVKMAGKIGAERAARIVAFAARVFLTDALVAAGTAGRGHESAGGGAAYALARTALIPPADADWATLVEDF